MPLKIYLNFKFNAKTFLVNKTLMERRPRRSCFQLTLIILQFLLFKSLHIAVRVNWWNKFLIFNLLFTKNKNQQNNAIFSEYNNNTIFVFNESQIDIMDNIEYKQLKQNEMYVYTIHTVYVILPPPSSCNNHSCIHLMSYKTLYSYG